MAKISTLILAKNEERNMADCIASVSFSDEILVIDDFSTDRTKEIAESLGARVVQRAMNGDWGGQQTFAIQAATYEWVFRAVGQGNPRHGGKRGAERLLDQAGQPVPPQSCHARRPAPGLCQPPVPCRRFLRQRVRPPGNRHALSQPEASGNDVSLYIRQLVPVSS